jgi:hypothetical protein
MFIPDPGSDFFPSRIPDLNCLHPGSRIRIKEFKYFNPPKKQKKWFLSSRKYISGLFIPDPDADILPIPGPGSESATLFKCCNIKTCLSLFHLQGTYSLVILRLVMSKFVSLAGNLQPCQGSAIIQISRPHSREKRLV